MNKLLALLSAILVGMVLFSGCTGQPAQTTPTPVQNQSPTSAVGTPETPAPASLVPASFPVGITWRLFSYSDGKGGTTYVIGDQAVTALFRADGQVSGSSGCNQYTATFTATGSSIKITPGMTTLMAGAIASAAETGRYGSIVRTRAGLSVFMSGCGGRSASELGKPESTI